MQLAANKLTLCASQAQAQHNTRHVHVRNEILIGLGFGVRSSFGGAAVEEIRKVSGPTVVLVFLRPGTRGFVGKIFWRSKLFRLSFGRGSAKS